MKRLTIIGAVLLVGSIAFCYQTVVNRLALANWNDLTTPSITQNYQLGEKVNILDTNYNAVQTWEYVKASIALKANGLYIVVSSGIAGSEAYVAAAAGLQPCIVCVPPVAFTAGYYGWVQIQGNATATNYSSTVTKGDYIVLKTGTTSFVDAGTTLYTNTLSTGTYLGNATSAQYNAGVTTATIYLNGQPYWLTQW